MTPTEIARMIDREEFAASSAAFRARALATLPAPRSDFGGNPTKRRDPIKLRQGKTPALHTVDGQSKTLDAWAVHLRVSRNTLTKHRDLLGSVEAAIRHISIVKAKQARGYDQTSLHSQGTGVGSHAVERGHSENSLATENGRISA